MCTDTLLEVDHWFPMGAIGDTARYLKIDYINRVNTREPSVAVFFLPSQPGSHIPNDPNAIVEWGEDVVLGDPSCAAKIDKLVKLDADERHFFVRTGLRTDYGIEELLRRTVHAVATRDPDLPAGITHLWLVPQYGEPVATMWSMGGGWTTVRVLYEQPAT